ncbi:hypothetical protein HELRODRAFT_168189 [Helobdella robusta]|uniref:Uncharacterized protein n=1 Tax=Helobdella robusta TaxID=6412 RepID=T1F099_HELRO|nr:hypothetical protein HELRODRAFT_168189 [Helobdella robusta]ESO09227.1 hypothetical protein HELRODRAFT_168189 [Helobdella robusta]
MSKQCKNRRQVAIENRKNSCDKHAPVNNSCFPLCSCFKTTHHFNSIPQNPRTICNEEVSKQLTTLKKSSSPACPTIDTMSSMKQPSQQPSIKKQLHFSIETQSDDAEKAKEEDDLDFKMKQRRRSSVAKVVKNSTCPIQFVFKFLQNCKTPDMQEASYMNVLQYNIVQQCTYMYVYTEI